MKRTTKYLIFLYLLIAILTNSNAQKSNLNNPINSFSFDVYNDIKSDSNNIFFSPYSIYSTLLLVHEGANGKTKEKLEQILYIKNNSIPKFIDNTEIAEVKIANSIWLDKKYKFDKKYKKAITAKYDVALETIDFENPNSAIAIINQWTAENTNQKINKLLSPNDIDSLNKAIFLNTVYFNGEWKKQFNNKNTTISTFFKNENENYKIDFLNTKEGLQYYANEELQFITKPYKDSGLSFCVILPLQLNGYKEIEDKLSHQFIHKLLDNMTFETIKLSLPKIKLTGDYNLEETELFSDLNSYSDFSIIKNQALNSVNIKHKSLLELNAKGTVAIAATAMKIIITGVPHVIDFNANHPFIFFIMDNKTQSIVFMGRYNQPPQEKKTSTKEISFSKTTNHYTKEPLYLLDNKKIKTLEGIDAQDIESINILPVAEATDKYGDSRKNGAIIITTKHKE
ncbi:serpin family protein [Flammeovirga kamogawensis]|uniref:Serpin domain-containing protein n=1 Tax=Flammeovirga kamogawensis TaxID=373891 RepID=A0ABX8H414_9BACT|nr:serpin family protein [Flammeovirga kamogawensis]QWG10399.1 hypothetical protein KM029_25830 [Flammeovirga kamogawensis]